MIYYRILKNYLQITQVDAELFVNMLEKHASKISLKELLDIKTASEVTAIKIIEFLKEKYHNFKIDSIQLVGDSYINDRLDTSDLMLMIIVDKKYKEVPFSLKAIAKRNSKITTKNPGIGQILGGQYFDIGSLLPTVEIVKGRFNNNELDHQESLEVVSEELGNALKIAPQKKIKKGIVSLLGEQTVIITVYKQNQCIVLNYEEIQNEIKVLPKTPTSIQTTLLWNYDTEELTLRVKFSRGQNKGWSSLKLACDYRLNK